MTQYYAIIFITVSYYSTVFMDHVSYIIIKYNNDPKFRFKW